MRYLPGLQSLILDFSVNEKLSLLSADKKGELNYSLTHVFAECFIYEPANVWEFNTASPAESISILCFDEKGDHIIPKAIEQAGVGRLINTSIKFEIATGGKALVTCNRQCTIAEYLRIYDKEFSKKFAVFM